MTAKYSSPGVYVQEVPHFPPAVYEVPTAVPAFIGYTEKAMKDQPEDLIQVAVKISSLREYEELYGGPAPVQGDSVSIHVKDFGNRVFDVRVVPDTAKKPVYNLYYAVRHFYDNGGSSCYIIAAGICQNQVVDAEVLLAGLEVAGSVDEVTLLSVPEAAYARSEEAPERAYTAVVNEMIRQASRLKDRIALVDPFDTDIQAIRDAALSVAENNYAAAYYPNLISSYSPLYNLAGVTLAYEVEATKSEPAYADGMLLQTVRADSALFFRIQEALSRERIILPPSPAVAGVCTRVDTRRGVWKAPANEPLYAVDAPEVMISVREQEVLQVDAESGKSINTIRFFAGRGVLVWGARTLAGNDSEWRYLPVRRFCNMVEESVGKSLDQLASEPNDPASWLRIRAMVENYLTRKWRDGALVGSRPQDAFYVRVGLGATMTDKDVKEGRRIVEFGLAVIRPAEFIIIRLIRQPTT